MQTTIDLFTVYRGKLSSLFPDEQFDLAQVVTVPSVEIRSNAEKTDDYSWTVDRSKNRDGKVDTIYVTHREQQGVVVAYIELQYGSDHFETFVSPAFRAKFLSVMFELEVVYGPNNSIKVG